MQVMLDSLEESSLDVIAQALQTIASMCSEKGHKRVVNFVIVWSSCMTRMYCVNNYLP